MAIPQLRLCHSPVTLLLVVCSRPRCAAPVSGHLLDVTAGNTEGFTAGSIAFLVLNAFLILLGKSQNHVGRLLRVRSRILLVEMHSEGGSALPVTLVKQEQGMFCPQPVTEAELGLGERAPREWKNISKQIKRIKSGEIVQRAGPLAPTHGHTPAQLVSIRTRLVKCFPCEHSVLADQGLGRVS